MWPGAPGLWPRTWAPLNCSLQCKGHAKSDIAESFVAWVPARLMSQRSMRDKPCPFIGIGYTHTEICWCHTE